MEVFVLILSLTALVSSEVKFVHRDIHLSDCSDTEEEYMYGLGGEEKYHADFTAGKGVLTLPDFADPYNFDDTFDFILTEMEICKHNLAVIIEAYKSPAEKMDKPQTSIYTIDSVQFGFENKLICHVNDFFPPPVNVSWTKNNVAVSEDLSLSQYRLNTDGTYNIFSTLSFIPTEGDIYTCSVSHTSLDLPQTKTWEVEAEPSSVGPAVVCGVGLSLGLLGVAAGTFFLIKGNNCN